MFFFKYVITSSCVPSQELGDHMRSFLVCALGQLYIEDKNYEEHGNHYFYIN